MAAWRIGLGTAMVVSALGACGGGDEAALSVDGLREAESCPLDLAGAVEAAGIDLDAPVEVEVETGSGRGGPDDAVLDQVGGTFVTCRMAGDAGAGAGDGAATGTADGAGAGEAAGEDGDGEAEPGAADGEPVDVTAELLASDEAGALLVFVPALQADLELTLDRAEALVDRFEGVATGEAVDLGAPGPVAIAPVEVDGAESAALYVSVSEGLPPDAARTVAEELLAHL